MAVAMLANEQHVDVYQALEDRNAELGERLYLTGDIKRNTNQGTPLEVLEELLARSETGNMMLQRIKLMNMLQHRIAQEPQHVVAWEKFLPSEHELSPTVPK